LQSPQIFGSWDPSIDLVDSSRELKSQRIGWNPEKTQNPEGEAGDALLISVGNRQQTKDKGNLVTSSGIRNIDSSVCGR
jgi:hypothetical protein